MIKKYKGSVKYALCTLAFIAGFLIGDVVTYKYSHRNDSPEIVRSVRDISTDDHFLDEKKPVTDVWEKINQSRNPVIALYILTVMKDPDFIDIFTKESGLRPDAKGWNCWYGDVSRACDVEDRGRAWSVDCGVAQLNFSGKECPKESFDPIWNIDRAYEKFQRQGKRAWVVTW